MSSAALVNTWLRKFNLQAINYLNGDCKAGYTYTLWKYHKKLREGVFYILVS